jgi:hypothetical protein
MYSGSVPLPPCPRPPTSQGVPHLHPHLSGGLIVSGSEVLRLQCLAENSREQLQILAGQKPSLLLDLGLLAEGLRKPSLASRGAGAPSSLCLHLQGAASWPSAFRETGWVCFETSQVGSNEWMVSLG